MDSIQNIKIRRRLILLFISLATLPCYCLGLVLAGVAPDPYAPTLPALTDTFRPATLTATLTPSMTASATTTPTASPTATATWTATITPSTTATPSLTASPTPTETPEENPTP